MGDLAVTNAAEPSARVRIFTVALDNYPPFRVDITELMDKALAGRGYDLDWAMWRNAPGPGCVIDLPGGHHCVLGERREHEGLFFKAKAWAAYTLRIARQIKVAHYDIVQVRDMPLFAALVMLLARAQGCRFTYWMSYPMAESRKSRANDPEEPLSRPKRIFLRAFGSLLEWVLYRVVLPRADHVFVQSDKMAADVVARGIARNKLTPVPMGVLLDELPPKGGADPFAGRKAIVHLGTLIRLRRPEFLLDVLAEVRRSVPDALLVLIGDAPAPDMAMLKERVRRSGLENDVRFTGEMNRTDALALTRWARVCVSPFPPHPLNDSTSPTKLIEYLALGRPAVVNDHPDQSRVIAQSGGGLATPYDVKAFAAAIVRLLEHPQEAEEMALKGPPFVAHHRAYPVLAAQVDEAYRALLTAPAHA